MFVPFLVRLIELELLTWGRGWEGGGGMIHLIVYSVPAVVVDPFSKADGKLQLIKEKIAYIQENFLIHSPLWCSTFWMIRP